MPNPNPLEAVAVGVGAGLLYWWFRSGSNEQRVIPKLPLQQQTVVINNYKECEDAVKILRRHCEENPALGFDCEWVWGSKGVDILQLCTHKGYCAVIRLCAMDTLPPSLYSLLNDYHVVKVGVAPLDDAGRLSREFNNLTTVSTLDLRFVAVLTGEKPGTLAAMYERVVGGTLNKCLDLSANWQANNLTQEQIDYAAGDAKAGMEIYTTLVQKVSDASVFEQYYDQRYDPHHHDTLKPIATNKCSPQ